MILTCPACHTSYTVKDGAIPPLGRTVRCAACKHSWHQVGEEASAPPALVEPDAIAYDEPAVFPVPEVAQASVDPLADAPAAAPPLAATGDTVANLEAAPAPEPEGLSGAEPPANVTPVPIAVSDSNEWNDAPYEDEEIAPRRRGPLIIVSLVLLIAVLAAAAYFLAPREWMARAGLAEASGDSPLKLMVTSQNRQKLASGNDLVSLSGRVINPTDQIEPVPALQADLRDGAGKLVYSWMIPPPAARLAPQASASFNAAELGVPAAATSLTLRWAS